MFGPVFTIIYTVVMLASFFFALYIAAEAEFMATRRSTPRRTVTMLLGTSLSLLVLTCVAGLATALSYNL